MSEAGQTIVARKISSARVSRSPIPQVEMIGEDFAKILDDRLRRLLRTITSSIILDCEVRKLSRVLESIPVPAMLGVVEVKNSPASALVNISNDLIYHIVDLRMGGDTEQSPVPTARSITPLDCALCSDFVNALIGAFTQAISIYLGAPELEWMSLRQFEQHVTMARIAPDNADVLVLNVSLDIGEAARSGDFDMVIPLSVLDSFKAASQRRTSSASERNLLDLWSNRMSRAAREAPVRVTSVIHRLHLDLGAIQEWKEGDVLEIPASGRSRIELMLPGQDEVPLAVGRLGAFEGQKAVKLTLPPDPDFVKHIRSLTGETGA
ncbi:FliM/FliN family flagellar motor switch protein [Oceanicella sp. SM1341]|uniref:FliM/FliN family flagellar motor switch protein n=1 Tax=Oceanicella sp. SM1341 TaxID=1548889 RepID=UPI0013003587|nr:FliM/FliN family flagellar motor switch protein [Oceanicella sp. SM1341]